MNAEIYPVFSIIPRFLPSPFSLLPSPFALPSEGRKPQILTAPQADSLIFKVGLNIFVW